MLFEEERERVCECDCVACGLGVRLCLLAYGCVFEKGGEYLSFSLN